MKKLIIVSLIMTGLLFGCNDEARLEAERQAAIEEYASRVIAQKEERDKKIQAETTKVINAICNGVVGLTDDKFIEAVLTIDLLDGYLTDLGWCPINGSLEELDATLLTNASGRSPATIMIEAKISSIDRAYPKSKENSLNGGWDYAGTMNDSELAVEIQKEVAPLKRQFYLNYPEFQTAKFKEAEYVKNLKEKYIKKPVMKKVPTVEEIKKQEEKKRLAEKAAIEAERKAYWNSLSDERKKEITEMTKAISRPFKTVEDVEQDIENNNNKYGVTKGR